MIDGARTAFGLLTVLPIGGSRWAPARAVAWYPAVGVVLAVLLGLAAAGLFEWVSPLLAAAVVVALWALLTGALHLDGLADTADAAFAPVGGERRLAILADVHHGTFAMVAVILIVLLKVAALQTLGSRDAAAAVALAVVASRTTVVPMMRIFRPARPGGMGEASRAGATTAVVAMALIVAAAAGLLTYGWQGLGIAGGGLAIAFIGGAWLSGRFRGLTGDCYGALIEVVETAVIVSISALATNGHASGFPLGGRL